MSAAADSFAAREHIAAGDWDDYLYPIWLAVRERQKALTAAAMEEARRDRDA